MFARRHDKMQVFDKVHAKAQENFCNFCQNKQNVPILDGKMWTKMYTLAEKEERGTSVSSYPPPSTQLTPLNMHVVPRHHLVPKLEERIISPEATPRKFLLNCQYFEIAKNISR